MTAVNYSVMSRDELLAEVYALHTQLMPYGRDETLHTVDGKDMRIHMSINIAPTPVASQEALRASHATDESGPHHGLTDGLREILTIVNSTRNVDDSLHQIIVLAVRLLSADAGVIYRLNESAQLLGVRAAHGLEGEDVLVSLPLNQGPIGCAVMQRRPVAAALNTANISDPAPDGNGGRRQAGLSWSSATQLCLLCL